MPSEEVPEADPLPLVLGDVSERCVAVSEGGADGQVEEGLAVEGLHAERAQRPAEGEEGPVEDGGCAKAEGAEGGGGGAAGGADAVAGVRVGGDI